MNVTKRAKSPALDVFSRHVTGRMAAYRENAELAKRLIEESCKKQQIQPGQLTLHVTNDSVLYIRKEIIGG